MVLCKAAVIVMEFVVEVDKDLSVQESYNHRIDLLEEDSSSQGLSDMEAYSSSFNFRNQRVVMVEVITTVAKDCGIPDCIDLCTNHNLSLNIGYMVGNLDLALLVYKDFDQFDEEACQALLVHQDLQVLLDKVVSVNTSYIADHTGFSLQEFLGFVSHTMIHTSPFACCTSLVVEVINHRVDFTGQVKEQVLDYTLDWLADWEAVGEQEDQIQEQDLKWVQKGCYSLDKYHSLSNHNLDHWHILKEEVFNDTGLDHPKDDNSEDHHKDRNHSSSQEDRNSCLARNQVPNHLDSILNSNHLNHIKDHIGCSHLVHHHNNLCFDSIRELDYPINHIEDSSTCKEVSFADLEVIFIVMMVRTCKFDQHFTCFVCHC